MATDQGAPGHRRMSNMDAGRSREAVRFVFAPNHGIRFLQKQALSEMPIDGSRQMAGADFSRASTSALFPRGVYPASAACSGGFAESPGDLPSSIHGCG